MNEMTFTEQSEQSCAPDKILFASQKAKEAVRQYGRDAVINATLGECLQEDGSPYTLPGVIETLKALPGSEFASYAPIGGVPGFQEACIKAAFGPFLPPFAHPAAVPAPGGSGALRLAFWNFLKDGDAVLTADWHWPAYKRICEEHHRRLSVFSFLDKTGTFSVSNLQDALSGLVSHQDHILLLLNTPAHNPTGYSMTAQELSHVLDLLETFCIQYPKKQFTLLLDLSYIEYAGTFEASRAAFSALRPLPPNGALLALYSMTKSFMLSGIRLGALLCLANTAEEASLFARALCASARGCFGSAVRCAQTALVSIMHSKELWQRVQAERDEIKGMLASRSHAFLQHAKETGLSCLPYENGFFISIPCATPDQAAALLEKKQVYLVPVPGGLRFSPCAVPLADCEKAPQLIQAALSERSAQGGNPA